MREIIRKFNELCGESDETILDEALQLIAVATIIALLVVIA